MGYYTRVLGRRDVPLSIVTLRACLPENSAVELKEENSDQADWSQLILRHSEGADIAVVEKKSGDSW
jgi:hypothetical protein